MADLNASMVESFIEATKQGTDEALAAYARTFGNQITIEIGESGPLDDAKFSAGFSKRGLALILLTGSEGILILIPSEGGLVPEWCNEPDATGQSKLSTFAQEWGMNLVPDDFFPDDFKAGVTENLYKASQNGKIGDDAGFLELKVTLAGGGTTVVWIVWPISEIDEVLKPISADDAPAAPATPTAPPTPPPATPARPTATAFGLGAKPAATYAAYDSDDYGDDLMGKRMSPDDLPGFSRSLLKIRVPVAAVLARARKPIKTILELGIGSVVQFDKSCDELIELELDRTIIANGEAVKVGEKFGLRINAILLPKERFRRVDVRRDGEFSKMQNLPQIIGKAPIKTLDPQNVR